MCNFKCFLVIFILYLKGNLANINEDTDWSSPRIYVYWPNATVPFYINPEHFDHYQSLSIMTTLTMFAFKTCLKFAPSLAPPKEDSHVMVFENPRGIRKCLLDTDGHSRNELHRIILGYDCLKSPQIDMIIMKALGFPFEHNREIRDNYIEVLFENIEPHAIELFTKDPKMPPALQALPYDLDSVMHFGERDYSKNGHRTIMFKANQLSPIRQQRLSLTSLDLKKIEIVYGPECRARDRQEKIELCQNYPGVARKKREVVTENVNLRVNRDITPPTKTGITPKANTDKSPSIKDLGIEDEVQDAIDHLYKVSAKALNNARGKFCNQTEVDFKQIEKKTDLNDVIDTITEFAKSMVGKAIQNLTVFCQASESMEMYQRNHLAPCSYYNQKACQPSYKSTKSGNVRFSTQHRPSYYMSTKNAGNPYKFKHYHPGAFRASEDNATELENVDTNNKDNEEVEKKDVVDDVEVKKDRKKRDVESDKTIVVKDSKELDKKIKDIEAGENVLTRRATDAPKKELKYARRRRFEPKRPQRGHNFDDSNISIERLKMRPTQGRKGEKREQRIRKEERESREERFKRKRPQRQHPASSGEKGTTKEMSSRHFQVVELSKKNEEFYSDRKWPDGVVPYMIKDDANYDTNDVRKRLEEVNAILKKKTCVKLKEISEKDVQEDMDYLVIDTSLDYVTGRVGGRQNFGSLELFQGGQHKQHAAMMVMAMLGFYFEIARHDRDKYIRVHLRHVRPDKLHHFEKIRSDATLPLPYDYESATHPAWQFWRKLGIKGISAVATFKSLDPNGSIMKGLGQHSKLLSDTDIIKINSVYGTECVKVQRSRQIHKKKFIKNRERYF